MKKLLIKDKNIQLTNQTKTATSFGERLIGLMFKKEMVGFDSLLIKECRSIHTFFMKYPIDVAFLNDDFVVKKIIRNMKPWRMSWIYITATQVLEMRAGQMSPELSVGDKLEVVCTS